MILLPRVWMLTHMTSDWQHCSHYQIPSPCRSPPIASVKITIPADIHVSSIEIFLNGATATVQSAELPVANQRAQTRSDRGGSPEEPLEDREQLEAAMQAQSVDLRQSTSSSSSGTVDDEASAGTGVGLALPASSLPSSRGSRTASRSDRICQRTCSSQQCPDRESNEELARHFPPGDKWSDHQARQPMRPTTWRVLVLSTGRRRLQTASLEHPEYLQIRPSSWTLTSLHHKSCHNNLRHHSTRTRPIDASIAISERSLGPNSCLWSSDVGSHDDEHSERGSDVSQSRYLFSALQSFRKERDDFSQRPGGRERRKRSPQPMAASRRGPPSSSFSDPHDSQADISEPGLYSHRGSDSRHGPGGANQSSDQDLAVTDLAESRLFSHADAESLYMSAVGNDFLASSARPAMPGAWTDADHSLTETSSRLHDPAEVPSRRSERRQLLSLDSLVCLLGEGDESTLTDELDTLSKPPLRPNEQHVPGSFSIYAQQSASTTRRNSFMMQSGSGDASIQIKESEPLDRRKRAVVDLDIGATDVQVDAATIPCRHNLRPEAAIIFETRSDHSES
ncbi:hypothetical protein MRB53_041407 [Persea americana]|nr:hypothetical protein MRB53_041407 [Persea americana]